EIGEMPAALQSRLLRVLQEREVMKLGSGRATPVDVRVIAATHRDLHALVEQGLFRADLYFRLNLLQIELPPLRERRGDVAQLARHLLSRGALQYGLSEAALERVLTFLTPLFEYYAWPGNVRELENLLTRAAIYLSDAAGKDARDLPSMFPEFGRMKRASAVKTLTVSMARADEGAPARVTPTREDVMHALEQSGGNRAAASRALGIGRTTLWRLMKTDPPR
ncbi:MAG TPA: sigma 54-interacting transcriptional regulator, partial [Paraburkholderia sp.]|nr:sigma 54-interacting transcriptional regulator [Paraburkholderia sp.]